APSAVEAAQLRADVYPWLVAAAIATAAWAIPTRDRSRPVALAFLAALVLQVADAFSYAVEDPVTYFLPAVALGLFMLPAPLARVGAVRRHAGVAATVAALALGMLGWRCVRSAAAEDAALVQVDGLLRQMWSAVPIRRGYVVWDSDLGARLVDYQ